MVCLNLELKEKYDEYNLLERKFRELIRSPDILNEKGQRKYNTYKDRLKSLKKYLKEYNIEV